MSHRLEHVILDLDGTLIDSAVLCTGIINQMLSERGSERRLMVQHARPFMSSGGEHLVTSLLAEDCGDPALELADFRRRYAELPSPVESLFDGIRDGLDELAGMGLGLALCSNKPQHLCEKVVRELGLAPPITTVVGTTPERRPKPDPQLIELVLEHLGTTADRCVLVGDSEQDHALAQASGVPFLFVSYGYADPAWDRSAVASFDSFGEVVAHIGAFQSAPAARRRAG